MDQVERQQRACENCGSSDGVETRHSGFVIVDLCGSCVDAANETGELPPDSRQKEQAND